MKRRSKRKRTEIESAILKAMHSVGKQRYFRPWSLNELRARAHVTVEIAEKALARLVRQGEIRRTADLPIVFYLEV